MSTDERPTACPNCAFPETVRLHRMRQHDRLREWFHCEKCDHFFTLNRSTFDVRVVDDTPTINVLRD